jgi:site-specific recombinase XerD
LEHYLMRIRPRLLRRPAIAQDTLSHQRGPLWISTRGTAMTAHALYYAVTRSSERLLGAPLNPHLLRDCAASAITTARPDHVLAASRILGHNQLSTTLTHYEQASMLEAGARLQEVLEEIQARQTGNPVLAADDSSDGPVTYLCRPQCSFRPLGVRRPRGFCLPILNADGASYRSR